MPRLLVAISLLLACVGGTASAISPRLSDVNVSGSATEQPDELRGLASELLRELTASLRRLNQPKPAESVWDRPIVITLIGTVLLGLLTTAWQFVARNRELSLMRRRNVINEQMQLLKELPRTYEHIGEVVNSWFVTVIWIAEETNKPQTTVTANNIASWKTKASDLEVRYSKAEPLSGLLMRIGVVYASDEIRDCAANLSVQWTEFMGTFQVFSSLWNVSQKLSTRDIDDAKANREAALKQLEVSKDALLKRMTDEVFASRQAA